MTFVRFIVPESLGDWLPDFEQLMHEITRIVKSADGDGEKNVSWEDFDRGVQGLSYTVPRGVRFASGVFQSSGTYIKLAKQCARDVEQAIKNVRALKLACQDRLLARRIIRLVEEDVMPRLSGFQDK